MQDWRGDIIPPALHDRHSAKVNVCAAVWENGWSEIYICKENLASLLYITILQNIIIKKGKNPWWQLETSFRWRSQAHFTEQPQRFWIQIVFRLSAPAKSPDLDIIDNVYKKMQQLGPQTAKTLKKSIKNTANSIQNCVLSMPVRLNLVMKSKEAAIKN